MFDWNVRFDGLGAAFFVVQRRLWVRKVFAKGLSCEEPEIENNLTDDRNAFGVL